LDFELFPIAYHLPIVAHMYKNSMTGKSETGGKGGSYGPALVQLGEKKGQGAGKSHIIQDGIQVFESH
jgi:hypothetical protein